MEATLDNPASDLPGLDFDLDPPPRGYEQCGFRTDDRRRYGRRPADDWNGGWDNVVMAYEEDR